MIKFLKNILRKKSDRLFEWDENDNRFLPIENNENVDFDHLINVGRQKEIILKNTILFSEGKPANNVLLWGARGTGKSSLVLASFKKVAKDSKLSMIEVKNTQIKSLSRIKRELSKKDEKYIIFCDDFSFDIKDENFLLFKNIVDGSARKISNIIFYATSNYRHLIKLSQKEPIDNDLDKKEFVEDTAALSDRFGIWLGFHNFDTYKYLAVVNIYKEIYKIKLPLEVLQKKALQWSIERGSRSGREAKNFIKTLIN